MHLNQPLEGGGGYLAPGRLLHCIPPGGKRPPSLAHSPARAPLASSAVVAAQFGTKSVRQGREGALSLAQQQGEHLEGRALRGCWNV